MSPTKIVIVDDDPDILAASQTTLSTAEYQVAVAGGRDEGMDLIHSVQPDLIVLDVMMTAVKDKTGVDFRASAGDPNWLPVEAFLEKPVDPDLLLAEVRRLLKL